MRIYATAPVGSRRRVNTAWNLFFHYTTIAFTIGQGVLLVPLYLRYVPLPLYGAWLATGNIVAWFTLIDPGLSSLLQQRVAEAYGRGDRTEIGRLTTMGLGLNACFVVLLLVGGLGCAPFVGHWVGLSAPADIAVIKQCFVIAVVSAGLMLGAYFCGAVNLGMQQIQSAGVANMLTVAIALIATVLFLHFDYGLLAIPLSMLLRATLWLASSAGIMAWRFRSERIPWFQRLKFPEGFAAMFGLTFLDRVVSGFAANVDAFLVARFVGAEQAVLFTLTRRPFQVCESILSRPALALTPAVAHAVGTGETVRVGAILVDLLRYFVWAAAPLTGALYAFNEDFVRLWVGSHVFLGTPLNIVLCVFLLCSSVVGSLANLCWALGNVRGNCLVNIAQSLLTLALLVVGLAWIGLPAVVLAPLAAIASLSLWYYPRRFSRLVTMTADETKLLARESITVVIATVLPAVTLHSLPRQGWLELVVHGIIYAAGYVVIMGVGSTAFRSQFRKLIHRSFEGRFTVRNKM